MQLSAASALPADSQSQTYVIMLEHAPTSTERGAQALAIVRDLLAQQQCIEQVFFYGPGVMYANCFLEFPSGLPDLQAEWLELASTYHFPLVVCATVGAQYGVHAVPSPQGNLQPGFAAGGLAEFISAVSTADRLLQL